MEETDMRVGADNLFAIEFENKS
jgi:hypothetical protein